MNHRFNYLSRTKKTSIITTILGIILFVGSLSIVLSAATITMNNNNNNIVQLALAQTPSATNDTTTSSSNLDTFNARGTISSLAADIITGTNAIGW
jgi:hypothetical protein